MDDAVNHPALSKTVAYLLDQNVDIDPRILILCPDLAGAFAKTYEYFLRNMQRLIRSVYEGNLGGDFVDIAESLIAGQLRQAYEAAWKEDGTGGAMPEYLTGPLAAMIADQQSFIPQLYKDIVDARVDETPVNGLLLRAEMWAGRYDEAQEMARHLITLENGGKEEWVMDRTKENCTVCAALNGIVAYAREWDELNVHPRNAPNPILSKEKGGCGGWKCGCERKPTNKRRSPKAFDTILNIVSG